MLGDLFDKLYGNSIVLANLRGQRRIPFLPEEEIDALREKRLREMVSQICSRKGRLEDVLFLPDGRFVHPRAVWSMIREDGILRFQFIQHEPNRFELKLMTVDENLYHRIVKGMVEDLRTLLGKSAVIVCQYCEELRPPEGGKFRPVLSLCKNKLF